MALKRTNRGIDSRPVAGPYVRTTGNGTYTAGCYVVVMFSKATKVAGSGLIVVAAV
jgi:hypothetical protein